MAKRSTVLKVAGMSKSFGPVVIVENFTLAARSQAFVDLVEKIGPT